MCFDEHNLR